MNAVQNIDRIEGVDGVTVIALAQMIITGQVIAVRRPDGQLGYAPAPALPCPACNGSCYAWDADFEIIGLCSECGGSGIEGGL